MARFNRTQANVYIESQRQAKFTAVNAISSKADGGGENTAEIVRDAINAVSLIEELTTKELYRQSVQVSPAQATMYLQGSSLDADNNEDKVFEMELLRAFDPDNTQNPNDPNGTGIIMDGVATGYQLIPIVTGNDSSLVWPATSGFYIPSKPFDGEEEIFAGSGATENMLGIRYPANFSVIGSCKPELRSGNQNNREVEIDLIVFNSLGEPVRIIGFAQEANQMNNNKATSLITGRVNLSPNFLTGGEFLGLAIRKGVEEQATTVTMTKAYIQISMEAIDE